LKKNVYYWLLAVLVLIYLVTIFALQPDSMALSHYQISALQLRLLSIAIIAPAVLIWVAAFYGMINVSTYAEKIKDTPDGNGFKYLAFGSIVIAVGMPITSLISRLLSYAAAQHTITDATATIINTHMTVAFYLVGFTLLFIGARKLLATIKTVKILRSRIMLVAAVLAVVCVPYIVVTLMNPSRAVPVAPATSATYAMSDAWIIATIIVPYIVTWTLGFYTALLLYEYYQNVRGKLYKKSLMKLNRGYLIVIIATIILQFITAASTSISGWGLGAVMMLFYGLLFIIAVGYLYIAFGAKGLAKLEEVT
jgi:hypothetical protein